VSELDLVYIGFISKTHGYHGHLKISIESDFMEAFSQCKFIFLNIETMLIPFFIEERKMQHNLLIKLEDIDSKEEAQSFNSSHIFIERKFITETEAEDSFKVLIGYIVLNDSEQIGILKDIQEFPQQLMGVIMHGDQELLIPLHDQLINSIDHDSKSISLTLPEGLLDLNQTL